MTDYNPNYKEAPKYYPQPGKFEALGAEIGRLVDAKHKAYGGGIFEVHKALKLMFPDISHEKLFLISLFARDLDKSWRLALGQSDAFEENPFRDKVGYMLLACEWWESHKHLFKEENE